MKEITLTEIEDAIEVLDEASTVLKDFAAAVRALMDYQSQASRVINDDDGDVCPSAKMPLVSDVYPINNAGRTRLERYPMLATMSVGDSFVIPRGEQQNFCTVLKHYPDKHYRTRKIDNYTARVWRIA